MHAIRAPLRSLGQRQHRLQSDSPPTNVQSPYVIRDASYLNTKMTSSTMAEKFPSSCTVLNSVSKKFCRWTTTIDRPEPKTTSFAIPRVVPPDETIRQRWTTTIDRQPSTVDRSSLSTRGMLEEEDPGRGGLQGTRPRAGQLGGPAPRGLGGHLPASLSTRRMRTARSALSPPPPARRAHVADQSQEAREHIPGAGANRSA
eukprot:1194591-Prorocentrum_minimum.AAC.6